MLDSQTGYPATWDEDGASVIIITDPGSGGTNSVRPPSGHRTQLGCDNYCKLLEPESWVPVNNATRLTSQKEET